MGNKPVQRIVYCASVNMARGELGSWKFLRNPVMRCDLGFVGFLKNKARSVVQDETPLPLRVGVRANRFGGYVTELHGELGSWSFACSSL